MAQLVARSVSFAFHDAVPILEDVDLSLDRRWWAVVGENGAGKTTLLRLLAGSLRPTAGVVRREPDDAVVVEIDQVVDDMPPDAQALADDRGGPARTLRDALRLDPLELERWSTLSPGERKRWQVGAALLAEPDVLLLDEPTNHLDATARRHLVRALRRFRGVGVVVTHDRDLMVALQTGTVRVRRGEVRTTTLGWDDARAAWEQEQRAATTAREAWRADVDRRETLLADARRHRAETERMRSTRARMRNPGDHEARGMGPKTLAAWAEKRAGRVVGVRRAELERARAAEPDVERVRDLGRSVFVTWEPSLSPRIAHLEVDTLRAGDHEVLRDVRLTLGREDRVRLAGDNGSGKTTLLRALVAAAGSARIAVVPQELDAATRQRLLHDVRRVPHAERGRVLSLLAALGSDPDRVLASASPSPGEARKLALAGALGGLAHAVVLDEPSNDLDLPAIERVEAAVAAFPGAVLLVTHDERLAAALTRTTWIVAGGTVHV